MKQNSWLNTETQQQYGPNTVLGSPRGWIQRALGQKSDLFLHATTTDPRTISVAGIWRQGQALPDTGSWPAIYRRFRVTDDIRNISRAKDRDFYSVIGMGVAVPKDRIFEIYNLYRQTALWVWFDWPGDVSARDYRASNDRTQLDHIEIYRLLDAGYSVGAIANMMNTHRPSIHYVAKKWQDGIPASQRKGRALKVDHAAVAQDLRAGVAIPDIVRNYDISRTMVYKIKQRFKI